MMNQEFKAKWIAALRSDKYKQGQRVLRNKKNEFCCLGVACDLYDPCLWQPISDLQENKDYIYYSDHIFYAVLPEKIGQEIGLDDHAQEKLAEMNDSGASFA